MQGTQKGYRHHFKETKVSFWNQKKPNGGARRARARGMAGSQRVVLVNRRMADGSEN